MGNKTKIDRFVKIATSAGNPPPPAPKAKMSGLYLLALRSHVAQAQAQAPIARRRLTIHLDSRPDQDGRPVPIKITLS